MPVSPYLLASSNVATTFNSLLCEYRFAVANWVRSATLLAKTFQFTGPAWSETELESVTTRAVPVPSIAAVLRAGSKRMVRYQWPRTFYCTTCQ